MYANVLTGLQAQLPALSSNSKHITVVGATHEALVSQQAYAQSVGSAIVEVIEAVRTGEPLVQ